MSKLNEETLDVLDFLIEMANDNDPVWGSSVPKYDSMLARAVLLRNYHQALRNIEECRRDEEVFNE